MFNRKVMFLIQIDIIFRMGESGLTTTVVTVVVVVTVAVAEETFAVAQSQTEEEETAGDPEPETIGMNIILLRKLLF